jgi:glycosyltransferase involved in cell wall biosynthesis
MKIVMIDSLVGNDYSLWLCRGLARAGHEVVLVCPEDRKNQEETFNLLPVSPGKAGGNRLFKGFKYIYFLIWLVFYLGKSQPDIIHYQFFRRERVECLYFPLLRLLRKPLFFTAHNILPHEHNAIDYYLRSLVYKSASKIIVHGSTIKERLLSLYKLPAEKVLVIPAVKPVSTVGNVSISKETARTCLNLAASDKILLFFGYIREYKGLDLLIDAFDIARASDKDLKLIIAGKAYSNELLEKYRSKISVMNFPEAVIFKPEFIPQKEVDYYFRAADALAVPYIRIDLSGVLQTAFAYSLPVLATNVGNFKELVQPGITGYITEQNTVEEFVQIIHLAFRDMNALSEMGKVAFIIDQNYPDWEKIGLLSSELYRQAIRQS